MKLLPLAVIDVQPAYRGALGPKLMDNLLRDVRARLAANVAVTFFFTAREISGDTLNDVSALLLEYGLSENELDRCGMTEKSFGYLQGWMSLGVAEPDIVMAQRALRRAKLSDTRDLSPRALKQLCYAAVELTEPLFLPHELEALAIPDGAHMVLAGGEREGGLREFELWLAGKNCRSDRLDHLTY